MPRKRKSNLSQRSNKARTMKLVRLNETSPQAELRRLKQAERQATYRAAETPPELSQTVSSSETPKQSQARCLQQANYMAPRRATETVEAAEDRADELLLKGHNGDD